MTSPLVSRPLYGSPKPSTSLAVAELPSGGHLDKGISLDSGIPGESTFAKPPDDLRKEDPKDESIYRVEQPGDLGKSQTTPDQIDHSDAKPSFNGLGKPPEGTNDKPKYPYRDGVPNAHNASFVAELWKLGSAHTQTLRVSQGVKLAAIPEEILNGLDPEFKHRAAQCTTTLKRADLGNLRWIFAVDCGNGPKAVKIRASRPGNVRAFGKLDLELSCSCPGWQWLGPEFHAKSEGYMLNPQVGTASTPDIRDPDRTHKVCKHVASVLSFTRSWEIPKQKAQKAIKKAMKMRK